ncbi:MAG: YaaR family protein [bacterium]
MDVDIGKVSRDRARRSAKTSKPGTGRATARSSSREPMSFNLKLLETRRENIREEMDLMLAGIDAQAKEIEKSLTFESLHVYREMIRKFVGVAVNELYEVEEKLSISPTGKKKSLLLVKRINEELEKLADEFLDKQKNLLGFLSRLDQIRGLLLDLYT